MPGIRSRAVGAAAGLAGLPWRLNPNRGRALEPDDPHLRRVAIIKPCCMGDLLMSTPAIAALRTALPAAHISLFVGDYARPAVANNPRLSQLVDSPVEGAGTVMADYLRLSRFIRRGRYGSALVLDRSPLLNSAPYLAGVPVRSGLDSDNRGVALTHPALSPSKAVRHEVQLYLDVVRALGLPAPEKDAYLEFYPTEADKKEAGEVLSGAVEGESHAGYIAIHLGGGSNPGMRLPSKRWQPAGWARIADWLAETYEPTILLLGGPGDEDKAAASAFTEALFPATRAYVTDLVGKLSWSGMGALLGRCDLFLGHDTGAMHLATAVRTPVVAVFGPSDPARFGPWDPSGRSRVVAGSQSAGDAEALRNAARKGEAYHSLVTPEQAWVAVSEVLATLQRSVPRA
ncbi:MAG: glycosyltransferase family 9 protein [Chloroflexota bacterium]|nr:glycosyltransferase family 9 protein [Chloroflexota bacterium]